MPDLTAVYAALHEIMAPYGARLDVKQDDADQLYIDTRHIQKNRKPLFFGAVQRRKSCVSYHLMPVYLKPELLAGASPELLARMQGKSCFQVSTLEPALLEEIAAITRRAFESYVAQGFV